MADCRIWRRKDKKLDIDQARYPGYSSFFTRTCCLFSCAFIFCNLPQTREDEADRFRCHHSWRWVWRYLSVETPSRPGSELSCNRCCRRCWCELEPPFEHAPLSRLTVNRAHGTGRKLFLPSSGYVSHTENNRNRYPGAMSDTESYIYRFSWDKEDLQQYHWKEHYVKQPEVLAYLNHVVERHDLRYVASLLSESTTDISTLFVTLSNYITNPPLASTCTSKPSSPPPPSTTAPTVGRSRPPPTRP